MSKIPPFIDRRRKDRRNDPDPCKDLPVDLYHRKRRKSTDRRAPERSLVDDYYAYIEAQMQNQEQPVAAQDASDTGDSSRPADNPPLKQ